MDDGRRPDDEPQPPAWQMPPMQPMPPSSWAAPKPGVIPLRPLGVGDILGGAIATMRTRPALTLGVTAIVVIAVQLLILAVTYPLLADLDQTVLTDPSAQPAEVLRYSGMTLLVSLIGLVLALVSRVFLSGFLTVVVGTAVLGQRPGFGEVMARVRRRLLPLLGLTLVFPAVLVAAVAIVTALMLAGPVLGVPVLLGLVVVGIWLWTLFSLATPALVLESIGVGRAFGRSRELVTGSWWRIFGITLLAAVIAGAVAFVIALPFESLGGGFSVESTLATKYLVLSTIGAVIAGTITEPFAAAVIALVYTDQRMRRERLDIELATAAAETPPSNLAP